MRLSCSVETLSKVRRLWESQVIAKPAIWKRAAILTAVVLLHGCEWLGTDEVSVGVRVSGPVGPGLVLQNNGNDDLAITAPGLFEFRTAVEVGSPYSITVAKQPDDSSVHCVVLHEGRHGIALPSQAPAVVRCGKVAKLAFIESRLPEHASSATAISINSASGALSPMDSGRVSHNLSGFVFPQGSAYAYAAAGGALLGYSVDDTRGVFNALIANPFGVDAVPSRSCVFYVGCVQPRASIGNLVSHPDGKLIFANYEQYGPCCPAIAVVSATVAFAVDANTGSLSQSAVSQGLGFTQDTRIEPKGRFLYKRFLGDIHIRQPARVLSYSIDPKTGALSQVGEDFRSNWPESFEPSGRFAYTVDPDKGSLQSFTVDPSTGVLATNGEPIASAGLNSLQWSVDGMFAYGGCSGGLCVFRQDMGSGVPTPLAGSPFPAARVPTNVKIESGGKFVLAICADAVCVWKLDPDTGVPTQVSGSPFLIPGELAPRSIVPFP